MYHKCFTSLLVFRNLLNIWQRARFSFVLFCFNQKDNKVEHPRDGFSDTKRKLFFKHQEKLTYNALKILKVNRICTKAYFILEVLA